MQDGEPRWQQFYKKLHEEACRIAPDYPNIQNISDPFELLWAITSSYDGANAANEDCHKFITYLREKLQMSPEEAAEQWYKLLKDERNYALSQMP